MNWISRKDKQINLKRKHSNINILDKIASNDITHVFKPNELERGNLNQHRPGVKNEKNFPKLIRDSNMGEQMKKIDNIIENILNENYLKNNFRSQYL